MADDDSPIKRIPVPEPTEGKEDDPTDLPNSPSPIDGDEEDEETESPTEIPDISFITSNLQASKFMLMLLKDIRDAVFDIAAMIEENREKSDEKT